MSLVNIHRFRMAAAVLLVAMPLALVSCSDDSDGPSAPATPKELNSPTLQQGGSFAHTFAAAGTFPYHCTIHSGMAGSVTVAAAGPDSAVVTIIGSAFAPQSATVKTGGYVRWVNNDGVPHTVTSD